MAAINSRLKRCPIAPRVAWAVPQAWREPTATLSPTHHHKPPAEWEAWVVAAVTPTIPTTNNKQTTPTIRMAVNRTPIARPAFNARTTQAIRCAEDSWTIEWPRVKVASAARKARAHRMISMSAA